MSEWEQTVNLYLMMEKNLLVNLIVVMDTWVMELSRRVTVQHIKETSMKEERSMEKENIQ